MMDAGWKVLVDRQTDGRQIHCSAERERELLLPSNQSGDGVCFVCETDQTEVELRRCTARPNHALSATNHSKTALSQLVFSACQAPPLKRGRTYHSNLPVLIA